MGEPWKNAVHAGYVADLATAVRQSDPRFDVMAFRARAVDDAWEDRELMTRLRHISASLREFLRKDYVVAVSTLRDAAPRLDNYGLQNLVFPEFVRAFGLDDWEASISAIEQFTEQTTGEFAVRPFIVADQTLMLDQMLEWTGHESPHVRRLASEGSRPRLPWGIALPALQADPAPLLPILEALKLDESEYVRRSVANNLNEIAKDHPDLAVDVLRGWRAHDGAEVQWITRHALRTLVKRGHADALEVLGYGSDPEIDIRNLSVDPDPVPWGGSARFCFDIVSRGDQTQRLLIDFVVYLMRANGRQTAKVFKLAQKMIEPGEVLRIAKAFSFQPVSSRRYYPGRQAITPKVNGREYGRVEFILAKEPAG